MSNFKVEVYSIAGVVKAIKEAYPDPQGMLDTFILVNWIEQEQKSFNREVNVSDVVQNYSRLSLVSPAKMDERLRYSQAMFESIIDEVNEKFIKEFIQSRESAVERIIWTCEIVKQVAAHFQVTEQDAIDRIARQLANNNNPK